MAAHLYLIQTEDLAGNLLPGVLMRATSLNGDWQAMTNPCAQKDVYLAAGKYAVDFLLGGKVIGHRDWDLGDPPQGPIRVGLDAGARSWTPAQLRAIRGAIWPTRGPVRFGPRWDPNHPEILHDDNIIDSGCFGYSSQDLATSRLRLGQRKYTHVQAGPFVDPGYHGQYPAIDFRNNPDEVLAWLESWWAAGFAVVSFIGPDGWTTEQMKTLEPIFAQPRWQAVCKQIVPYGWEPSEDTSNAEFVERFRWARRVFPSALQYIHLAADFDAPGNNDDFTPGPKYIGHAKAWANVVPYLTGFLIQNGPYGVAPAGDPTLALNFGDQFRIPAVTGSLRDRFVNGYAGWPTACATGGPLDLIAAEQTSFNAYWNNLPEPVSLAWGQLAQDSDADGFFDGGPGA